MHRDHILYDLPKQRYKAPIKQEVPSTTLFGEIKTLVILFAVVLVAVLVFTNIPLFIQALHNPSELSWLPKASADNRIANTLIQAQEDQERIQALISQYKNADFVTQPLASDIQTTLQNNMKTYDFSFNTLPPTNRVIIQNIGLDIPLIHVTHKAEGDFVAGDFDDELQSGVVKYPTTPAPGEGGNTLIFGHTSQERWQHNGYGTIFANLPKLKPSDEIQVVWEGELHTYKVVETVVKRPKEVDKEFQKRQAMDGEFVTLMGCYPLGTTKQRMMVIAQKVE